MYELLINDYPSLVPFENRTGRVAPYDDRRILHNGSPLGFKIVSIYAFGLVRVVFYISLAGFWRPHSWFRPRFCGGEVRFGLVVQRTATVLACFARMVFLTFDIDDDAHKGPDLGDIIHTLIPFR